MAVIRIALQRLGRAHEAFAVGHRHRDLAAELIGTMRFAFGNAHHLGRMQAVQLVLARALLHQEALGQPQQRSMSSEPRN